ncbi:hypothetical protein AFULGI_00019300 [Archaeoglobus fulgidus DSM 8774]|uniref:DUF5343 domain-containing protein n=1 Tax=Archaeoglobus fulgidus DSM 8774 TaxID=1344584 RepID=A0A075WFB4_ARCFL|nr:DUF5343 domain-containing protein [Archaeoglobus fulgidus]AIG98681.1 hypothetical protein AFULGI_00019300 [Archaeoglobus fulgidus DSM 8774]
MAEFPYTTVPGKIKPFFQKIQEAGLPSKVTQKWINSIGFTSSNDPSIIPLLKKLGFIDRSGVPTELWARYRDKDLAPKVMAEGKAENTIEKMIQTFKALCELADFESNSEEYPHNEVVPSREGLTTLMEKQTPKGLTINVNIQLQLPATTDEEVYDKLFRSLKRNLLSE